MEICFVKLGIYLNTSYFRNNIFPSLSSCNILVHKKLLWCDKRHLSIYLCSCRFMWPWNALEGMITVQEKKKKQTVVRIFTQLQECCWICVCKGGETKTCNFSTYISHLKIVITLTCVLMLGPNALPVFVLCYFASCFCHCGGFYRW